MAREKYKTLTEQMFYILICLKNECCGVDIMKMVAEITKNRVTVGAGTLYTLLDNFVSEKMIVETRVENRKKSYLITDLGNEMLDREYKRLKSLISDFDRMDER